MVNRLLTFIPLDQLMNNNNLFIIRVIIHEFCNALLFLSDFSRSLIIFVNFWLNADEILLRDSFASEKEYYSKDCKDTNLYANDQERDLSSVFTKHCHFNISIIYLSNFCVRIFQYKDLISIQHENKSEVKLNTW